jgi:hypothetical protein
VPDVRSPNPPAGPPISLQNATLLLAVSAPIALAFETLLRTQVVARVIGPDFNLAREFFSPTLTRCSWALAFITVVAGILGVALVPMDARRVEEAARRTGRELDHPARVRQVVGRLFLLSSIPQAPAILATFCFTFGSRLPPVLLAMAVSTAAVVAQGVVAGRLLRARGAPP